MNERARLRVRASGRRPPERGAQEDRPESVGVHVRIHVFPRARAVVIERSEVVLADPTKVLPDDVVARRSEGPEPRLISGRGVVVGVEVGEGLACVVSCGGEGSVEGGLLVGGATVEVRALGEVLGGDCERAAGEFGDIGFAGGAELGYVVAGVEDVEEVEGFDCVGAVAGVREVVCRRHCERETLGKRGLCVMASTYNREWTTPMRQER